MKLFKTALMGALLTFTVATVAQASPTVTPEKAEIKNQNITLAKGCNGWNPRGCEGQ